MQLIKSMKASLMKQTAEALKACQAADKPAAAAKSGKRGAAPAATDDETPSAALFSQSNFEAAHLEPAAAVPRHLTGVFGAHQWRSSSSSRWRCPPNHAAKHRAQT